MAHAARVSIEYAWQAAGAQDGSIDLSGFERWCATQFGTDDKVGAEGWGDAAGGLNGMWRQDCIDGLIMLLTDGLGMEPDEVEEIVDEVPLA